MIQSVSLNWRQLLLQKYWNRYSQCHNTRSFSLDPMGGRLSPQPPDLYIETESGPYEHISEEDLYRHTRRRWLCNEQKELSKRYVRFDLQELIRAALDVSDGSRYCTRLFKCLEGLHNKAFILTMDNGVEVFAKLPNSSAGPARYTTASEVATYDMLREVFKVPVPRVLAWSTDATNNSVGAEYIIQEKVQGVRLGSLWNQWPRKAKFNLIKQVVDMENKLITIAFPWHGCIYYKDDLLSLTGDAKALTVDSVAPEALERFAIGPLTSAELWTGARKDMKLDRGPWRNPIQYTQALGKNEIGWIKSHAKSRMNHYRSMEDQEHPEDGLALLTQYMDAASYLIPSSDDEVASSNVLWHPDLHLDNVYVDPNTHEITSIIDWQSACVAPLFYQSAVPRMFQHPKPVREGWAVPQKPENFDSLSEEEQNEIQKDLESEAMHKYYEAQVYKRAPRHWSVLQRKTIPIMRKPVELVTGLWERRNLFFLRQSLIVLAAYWEEVYSDSGLTCPLQFTKPDLELYQEEEENIDGVGQLLTILHDQVLLPHDGMVRSEDYEAAVRISRKIKEIFLGLAQDETQRELFSKLWPYQETED
ncbi:phosphotransferase family protein [Aspergillus parasiticus]|uniref:Phosphotransferase family protein n=1 Tax=Aspergillus parasiticus TaxID=5067 RepID=A0A5N6DSM7_ASPPA|nr:phosphotransferase family protein [Aspergillus parasiticus]